MITHPTSVLGKTRRAKIRRTLLPTRDPQETDDVECSQWPSAHGVDVGERVAAAIWPYENGFVDNRCEKSTVCTSARWRSNRYTTASSNVFELTSTFPVYEMGSCGKTCRRACWAQFDAHPAPDEATLACASVTRHGGSLLRSCTAAGRWLHDNRQYGNRKSKSEEAERLGIETTSTLAWRDGFEDREATRHPSLSGWGIADWGLPIEFFVRPSRF